MFAKASKNGSHHFNCHCLKGCVSRSIRNVTGTIQEMLMEVRLSLSYVVMVLQWLEEDHDAFYACSQVSAWQGFSFPNPGVSFSAMQQDSQGPPESDNDSEDPDEADNRKLRMSDGMSLTDVQQLLHPDYVKLRDTAA